MPPLDSSSSRGRAWWRSLEELADTPQFRERMFIEFPAGGLDLVDTGVRRRLMRVVGAALARARAGVGFQDAS